MSATVEPQATIEQRTIDWIPENERHGKPRSLFFVWFAANTSITALVTGALFVILGNSPLWSIPAIILGNVIGGFITALHSAQGPKLGVPQMIQSRAQFGYFGAILPLVLALFVYLGFYATGLVLGGQAIGELVHVSPKVGAVIFAVFSTVLAIIGYRWIHRFSHFAAVVSCVVFVILLALVIGPNTEALFSEHGFALAPFVLGVSISASWQLTFGPYIADYSRYLPASTPQRSTIGWTFLGSVVGASLAMVIGAFAAAAGGEAFSNNQVAYLASLFGALAWIVSLTVVIGKLVGNTLSAYGGFMSLATILTAMTRKEVMTARARVVFVILISLIAAVIAYLSTDNFIGNFTNFLLFLLYFITPWSAINLVDFYLVRLKEYDIKALFDPNGRYGKVNAVAFVAYFAGILVQVPFINSSLYVGPIANLLGGAEVAWIIGLVVSGGIFLAFTRKKAITEPNSSKA